MIVEKGELLEQLLKAVEGGMVGGKIQNMGTRSDLGSMMKENGSFSALSRTNSLTVGAPSAMEIDEEEEALKDPREWMKVIDALEQPRLIYNPQRKNFEGIYLINCM